MAQGTRAAVIKRHAKINSEFGYDWSCKLFGKETIDGLQRYQRGPQKGQLKGYVHWEKCEKGGWDRKLGSVIKPGQIVSAWIGKNAYSQRKEAIIGHWLGREGPLASGSGYLFEQGRERHARELEQIQEDQRIRRKEIEEAISELTDNNFTIPKP